MTPETLLYLCAAVSLTILVSAIMFYVGRRPSFNRLPHAAQQIIFGIVFGLVAIIGTEFGIPLGNATINVRDAAPLCAGLIFGGPAGIIAGLIGGIERWFAAYWGKGEFTQIACTVATILAGLVAALARKHIFEGRRPRWSMAFAVGVTVEVGHLTLVFVTNIAQVQKAFSVVWTCTAPMVGGVAAALTLSVIVVALMNRESLWDRPESRRIAQIIQVGMMMDMAIAFVVATIFVWVIQNNLATANAQKLMSVNIADVEQDIEDASDANMLKIARSVAKQVPTVEGVTQLELQRAMGTFNLTEVSVIDATGHIVASTNPNFVGFDMASGKQSEEFLVLLNGEEEYVQSYQPMASNQRIYRKYAGVAIEGGFIQVGYGADRFQDEIIHEVQDAVRNRHVGNTGVLFVVDEDDELVSGPKNITPNDKEVPAFREAMSKASPDQVFVSQFDGGDALCLYRGSEGYRIIAMLPASEAHFPRDLSVVITGFMLIIVFATLFLIIYLLLRLLVVDNIYKVNDSLALISSGKLDTRVEVGGNIEFLSLSTDINSTVDTLKDYISEAEARIDEELEYARTIQRGALPSVFPPFPSRNELDIFASMTPAREVGGDFYDFYFIDDDHLVFLVADVSGKGIPAALFMMTSKTLLRGFAQGGGAVNESFAHANAQLAANNEAHMFVTCWMGVLDVRTGHVTFANAGHDVPALRHEDGSFSFIKQRSNFVLAGMARSKYRLQELDLEPGDTLFLYTDGAPEATNLDNQLFGNDRLIASLDQHVAEDVEGLCKGVYDDVMAFTGDAEQFDDVTLMALRYWGPEGRPADAAEAAVIAKASGAAEPQ